MSIAVYTLALLLTAKFTLAELEVFRGQCLRTGLFQASEEGITIFFLFSPNKSHEKIRHLNAFLSYQRYFKFNMLLSNFCYETTCSDSNDTDLSMNPPLEGFQ